MSRRNLDPIFIPNCETVEELRQSVETALSRLTAQLGRDITNEDLNLNAYRTFHTS